MDMTIRSSARRGDGAATRAQLLEAAGRIIAEKGFDRATGKEIAEAAGSNSAAINYYFGGMEGLHAEVLVEAHRSVASYDELAALARGALAPEEKLRQLIGMAIAAVTQSRGHSWALRVLSREFLAPTAARQALEDRELLPKKKLITSIVAEVIGLPEDDPIVDRCCLSILAPITMLLVCERDSSRDAFPCLAEDRESAEAMVAHLHAFALGGIAAVARAAGLEPAGTVLRG
jgi:TetR/AcrR family transcriptional regulator, regulator of cefoperazone and chloramphenicol sensitivity